MKRGGIARSSPIENLPEWQIKERRNIPLAEVSEATSISRRALYAWENNSVNRFDVPIIDKLCKYFGVKPGDLFEYIEDTPEQPTQTKRKTARK